LKKEETKDIEYKIELGLRGRRDPVQAEEVDGCAAAEAGAAAPAPE
jgi:hypothetical protein